MSLKHDYSARQVASFYNPNALEVEAGRTVTGSRLSSATQEVQDLGLPETKQIKTNPPRFQIDHYIMDSMNIFIVFFSIQNLVQAR